MSNYCFDSAETCWGRRGGPILRWLPHYYFFVSSYFLLGVFNVSLLAALLQGVQQCAEYCDVTLPESLTG